MIRPSPSLKETTKTIKLFNGWILLRFLDFPAGFAISSPGAPHSVWASDQIKAPGSSLHFTFSLYKLSQKSQVIIKLHHLYYVIIFIRFLHSYIMCNRPNLNNGVFLFRAIIIACLINPDMNNLSRRSIRIITVITCWMHPSSAMWSLIDC